MESVLRSLRKFSSGVGDDASVFKTAAAVPLAVWSAAESAAAKKLDPPDDVGEEDEDDRDAVDGEELLGNHADSQIGMAIETVGAVSTSSTCEVLELYSWGQSKNYQLGFGAHATVQPLPRLVQVPPRIQVKTLSSGQFHSVAVCTCGSVLSWGYGGTSRRLGYELPGAESSRQCVVEPKLVPEFGPSTEHHVVKASAGMNHTLVLTSKGKVLSWGSNSEGQLGATGIPVAEQSSAQRPQLIKGELKTKESIDIAAGAAHSLCVVSTGALFAWGSNSGGGLGLGEPPAGPVLAAHPQQLPHLKGAVAVAASPSGSVSVVLANHGVRKRFRCRFATS